MLLSWHCVCLERLRLLPRVFVGCEQRLGECGKMQAVKDKLQDMNAMRKAKAAAKEEEKVRKKHKRSSTILSFLS